jgi:hypothetical protein
MAPESPEKAPALRTIEVGKPGDINYMGVRECAQYYRGEDYAFASGTARGNAESARIIKDTVAKLKEAAPGPDTVMKLEVRAGKSEATRDTLTMQRFFKGYLAALAEEAHAQGFNLEITVNEALGRAPVTVARMHDVPRTEKGGLFSKPRTYESFEPAPADPTKPTYRLTLENERDLYTGGTWGSAGGGGAHIGYLLAGKLASIEPPVRS